LQAIKKENIPCKRQTWNWQIEQRRREQVEPFRPYLIYFDWDTFARMNNSKSNTLQVRPCLSFVWAQCKRDFLIHPNLRLNWINFRSDRVSFQLLRLLCSVRKSHLTRLVLFYLRQSNSQRKDLVRSREFQTQIRHWKRLALWINKWICSAIC